MAAMEKKAAAIRLERRRLSSQWEDQELDLELLLPPHLVELLGAAQYQPHRRHPRRQEVPGNLSGCCTCQAPIKRR